MSTSSALASIIQTPSPMISAPAVAVIQPTEPPKGSVISFAKQRHSNDEDGPYMWPTPPSIKFRKLHDIVKADLKDNLWPTPAHLRPMMQHKSTQAHQTLIDYNTDRRSSLWSKQGNYVNMVAFISFHVYSDYLIFLYYSIKSVYFFTSQQLHHFHFKIYII